MSTDIVTLKRVGCQGWAIFGPKGNQISNIYRGNDPQNAMEWAKRWCQPWYNWSVQFEEIDDEKENRVSKSDF